MAAGPPVDPAPDRSLRLAEFAGRVSLDHLPAEALDRLRQCLLDFVGIAAFAAAGPESSGPFRAAVQALAPRPGPGTVVGESRGYPYQYAALLNGAFAHTLDFDDTNLFGALHPGAPVIPAALALAEREGVSGRRFLEALAAGYEVACRVGAALGPTAYDRGFHITAVAGIFGAVAAGARILELGPPRVLDAFGIALSQAAGSMQYLENGAWTKRLHPGLAAHDALVSLALAGAGVRGAARPLDGRYGLLAGYSNAPHPEHLVDGLGARWRLGETAIKPYPSCRLAHGAIDAALGLRGGVDAPARERASIEIRLSPKGYQIVGEPVPQKVRPGNTVEGQFSVYFQVAAAWLDGRVDWSSYGRLEDPRLHALMDRIRVKADETLPLAGGAVTVSADGREVSSRVEQPLGEPERPLPWALLEAKFEGLAAGPLGSARARAIARRVRALEGEERIAGWIRLLRAPRRQTR
jgi:2-methylcitrate dehydratase PrpD